jgi:hypothetical protein
LGKEQAAEQEKLWQLSHQLPERPPHHRRGKSEKARKRENERGGKRTKSD